MANSRHESEYLMSKSDEAAEKARLDLQHQVWLLTLEGRLHTTSLPNEVKTILDIGCGTGAWPLAMAKLRPSTQILATDLTPPAIIPSPNVKFVTSDANQPWPFGKFDFIHGRMLASGIHNWPRFLSQCWQHLEPGGYLELLDIYHPFCADDPAANSHSSAFIRFGHAAEKSWALSGLDYRACTKHTERLKMLGFVDVKEMQVKWALGEWPTADRERQMGKLTLENFARFLDTAGVHILTHNGVMSEWEARRLVAEVLKDIEDNCLRKFTLAVNMQKV
ncbi:MAG: hypothetical protein MMC33_010083 [Icmadophila ericetorum]|nr:hypothetical protein [Icmadophila ericetorum]